MSDVLLTACKCMHYSRIMPLVEGRKYLPSTAVLASEVIKFTISLTMALYELQSKLHNAPATTLFSDLLRSVFTGDSWKMAIPALLYSLQNSLQYIAASNLDASTLQITYQLKILTTALFSVLLLRRKLTGRKWLSLFMLAIGVTLVQVPLSAFHSDSATLSTHDSSTSSWFAESFYRVLGIDASKTLTKRSATYQGIDEDYKLYNPHLNGTIGLLAVLVACATSGLAGVYFEMVLKDGSSSSSSQMQVGARSSSTGVWIRNTQLSFYSLFPALFIGVIFNDGEEIAKHGFLAGYNWVVITVVLLQASGGILVSLVIKYADNIAKNFATSIGIIISFVISFLFLDLEPSFHVSCEDSKSMGILLTCCSTSLELPSSLVPRGYTTANHRRQFQDLL